MLNLIRSHNLPTICRKRNPPVYEDKWRDPLYHHMTTVSRGICASPETVEVLVSNIKHRPKNLVTDTITHNERRDRVIHRELCRQVSGINTAKYGMGRLIRLYIPPPKGRFPTGVRIRAIPKALVRQSHRNDKP